MPREVLRRMGELGFLGIRYPAEYGGSEMDTLGSVVLAEELGRSTFGGVAITVLVHTDMASVHMAHAGTPAQQARWMPDDRRRHERSSPSRVTEPDAGSDVKGIRTTARRDGETYVLNGAKMFITNGVHADLYLRRRQDRARTRGRRSRSRCSWSRRARPASGVARARQARLALLRHGRARVRGLPRAGREPARRGGPRLLRHHAQLPERADW